MYKQVIALSTDKAAAPENLYGATKLCSDKLFLAANNIKGDRDLKLSVVRYGNVMGSRGSVIPLFMQVREKGVLPITDPNMTRFNILADEGVEMVFWALENQWGGELFIPKIPSFRITDLAQAIAPSAKQQIVGLRPGEKVHEEMITEAESYTTWDLGQYFVVLPQTPLWDLEKYQAHFKGTPVTPGFKYNSSKNLAWLSVDEIRKLISEHLYPDFQPA